MSNVLKDLFYDIAESIRAKTGNPNEMSPYDFPAQIKSISVGGGGGEGCVTVTFMDGDDVLFTRPVYIGDNCPDPIAQGRIEKPTKESTVDKVYTYSGWSLTDGGSASYSALYNVKENRTLYASYNESVRYYTVNFYDGEELVNTEQVAYGGSSTYTYKKDNHLFNGWNPEPVDITGDLDCYGMFEESYTFANASWEYIAQMAESGNASAVFKVGDKRSEWMGEYFYTFEIIGFNHDIISGTTQKAGITIWCQYDGVTAYKGNHTLPWADKLHVSHEQIVFDRMSSELQSVIKSVDKQYMEEYNEFSKYTGSFKIWSLSGAEINASGCVRATEGVPYEKFSVSKSFKDEYADIKIGYNYFLRSWTWQGYPMYVTATGKPANLGSTASRICVMPCFCI